FSPPVAAERDRRSGRTHAPPQHPRAAAHQSAARRLHRSWSAILVCSGEIHSACQCSTAPSMPPAVGALHGPRGSPRRPHNAGRASRHRALSCRGRVLPTEGSCGCRENPTMTFSLRIFIALAFGPLSLPNIDLQRENTLPLTGLPPAALAAALRTTP